MLEGWDVELDNKGGGGERKFLHFRSVRLCQFMLEGWDVELDNYIFLQVSLYVDKQSMTFISTRYRKFS